MPRLLISAEERFWSKVRQQNDCWVWQAGLDKGGYGKFRLHGYMRLAHRLSYEWMIRDIPDGLTLDHECKVRNCVNPYHLDPVPQAVNASRRSVQKPRMICRKGIHPLVDGNLVGGIQRRCQICANEYARKIYHERKNRV